MRCLILTMLFAALMLPLGSQAQGQPCPFKPWMAFRGVSLHRTADGSAYAYKTSHVAIDADGSASAYCQGDKGLDLLANAGYPDKSWWNVLVRDPVDPSKPFVQPEGPSKGCYVSQTSLRAAGGSATDHKRYVDAAVVPYLVFPPGFLDLSGTGFVGDIAAAQSGDGEHSSPAIFADTGGSMHSTLGEMSIRLAEALGASKASPRVGAPGLSRPVTVVVFRQSYFSPKWPVANEDIAKRSKDLLARVGGWSAVRACAL
jgi:hypothetical protein